jgi:hypothetical protein
MKQLKSLRRGNKDCEGLWKYSKEKGIGGKTRGDWSVERGEEARLGGKLSRELTRVKGLGSQHPKLLGCDASYCVQGCGLCRPKARSDLRSRSESPVSKARSRKCLVLRV